MTVENLKKIREALELTIKYIDSNRSQLAQGYSGVANHCGVALNLLDQLPTFDELRVENERLLRRCTELADESRERMESAADPIRATFEEAPSGFLDTLKARWPRLDSVEFLDQCDKHRVSGDVFSLVRWIRERLIGKEGG